MVVYSHLPFRSPSKDSPVYISPYHQSCIGHHGPKHRIHVHFTVTMYYVNCLENAISVIFHIMHVCKENNNFKG